METKLHNPSKTQIAKFAASYSFYNIDCMCNGARGRSGGILLLWNNCTCKIDIIDMDFNYIDAIVTNNNDNTSWRATGLYGYPQHHNKHLTCDLNIGGFFLVILTWFLLAGKNMGATLLIIILLPGSDPLSLCVVCRI
jgi:hypothetical protein